MSTPLDVDVRMSAETEVVAVRPVPARHPIPWRVIFASIFAVLAVAIGVMLVVAVARILTWIVVAGFFAVVLTPIVDLVHRRLHMPRGLSVAAVFVVGLLAFGALMYAFIHPLVTESKDFAGNFSTYVTDARAGRGPVGHLVKK